MVFIGESVAQNCLSVDGFGKKTIRMFGFFNDNFIANVYMIINLAEVYKVVWCNTMEWKNMEALKKFKILSDNNSIFVKSKRTTGASSPSWQWATYYTGKVQKCISNDIFARVIENGGAILFHKQMPAFDTKAVKSGKC